MNKYVCHRESEIEKVMNELKNRLDNSNGSVELNMKSGEIYLVAKNQCDYQVYYMGDRFGDIDCDLKLECESMYDVARYIITR